MWPNKVLKDSALTSAFSLLLTVLLFTLCAPVPAFFGSSHLSYALLPLGLCTCCLPSTLIYAHLLLLLQIYTQCHLLRDPSPGGDIHINPGKR